MAVAKWMKLGAAAALSVSMLGACTGDGDDDTIEVDDPVTGEDNPEEQSPTGEDNTDEQLDVIDDEEQEDGN